MNEIVNKRTSARVNYAESSDDELSNSIANDVIDEVMENFRNSTAVELNKKKQYKKIYQSSEVRNDWEIIAYKSVPKGNELKDCYYFYVSFNPGVFKILTRDIVQILQADFDLKLKSGRPERYGNATIKSICNFKMKVGEREKTLQICFYHTNNVLDVKVTGNPRTAGEKFSEFGLKNGAYYFIKDVMPEIIDKINRNNDVEASKQYWSNLAKIGYLEEVKKDKKVVKGSKNKCGHCNKTIGQKVAIQCESCDNLNLVECLRDIEEGRINDFIAGKDTFYCNKCVLAIDVDTLAVDSSGAREVVTLEEADEQLMIEGNADKSNEEQNLALIQ